jgi:hypothetical protein
MLLARLEARPEIETALAATFERLLARYRETNTRAPKSAEPARRDWRRNRGAQRPRPAGWRP